MSHYAVIVARHPDGRERVLDEIDGPLRHLEAQRIVEELNAEAEAATPRDRPRIRYWVEERAADLAASGGER